MHPRVRLNASMAACETSTAVLRLMAISRSRASTVVSLDGPVGGEPARHVYHHIEAAEMLERDLHRQSGDVRLGQVAGTGSGVHALGGELPHPGGDAHRIEVAGHDFGPRLAEGERHGVADLPGTAHPGDQDHLTPKIEAGRTHADSRPSRMMLAPGAPAWV